MSKKWSIVEPEDFNVDSKNYRLNSKIFIRVTQSLSIIAKPGVRAWMAREGKKKVAAIMTTRQNLGTTVHNLFERTLKGEVFNLGTYEKEIQEDLELFDEFKINTVLEPEGLEQHLWSNKYGYAGTADFIGRYKSNKKYLVRGWKANFPEGARVVGDWKTSADIYNTHWLQLAAYIFAFEELTGIKLEGGFIAQFRNGKVRVKEKTYTELKIEFKAYLHALALYKWQHKL